MHVLSRCHRCILAARSEFLAALLEQPLVKRDHMTQAALTRHEQQPRSPGTFWQNAYLPPEVCWFEALLPDAGGSRREPVVQLMQQLLRAG